MYPVVSTELKRTGIHGLFVIPGEVHADSRGVFVEMFEKEKFAALGIYPSFDQDAISCADKRGTVRGFHFQREPHAQAKLVRCQRGAIYDVAVDLRRSSPSYLEKFSIELKEDEWRWLYLPPGIAHGFCTLAENTQVVYKISGKYSPRHASGINWLDPEIGIDWPVTASQATLSTSDHELPEFDADKIYFT